MLTTWETKIIFNRVFFKTLTIYLNVGKYLLKWEGLPLQTQ